MDEVYVAEKPKTTSWTKRILLGIAAVMLILLVLQYFNAARYEALVQVVEGDQIGVNPTDERLDFGDLPRDKNAIRIVNLESKGNIGAYVIVWKRGEIGEMIDVDKNFFTLQPHTTQELELGIHIPNSAEYRYYKGKVVIFQIPKFW